MGLVHPSPLVVGALSQGWQLSGVLAAATEILVVGSAWLGAACSDAGQSECSHPGAWPGIWRMLRTRGRTQSSEPFNSITHKL